MLKNKRLFCLMATCCLAVSLMADVEAKIDSGNQNVRPAAPEIKSDQQKLSPAESHFSLALSHIGLAHSANSVARGEKLLNEAEVELTKALALKNDFFEALYFRGVVYLLLGRIDDGESDLERVVKIKPDLAEAHYNLACLYAVKNNHELSYASLDKALTYGFNDVDHLLRDPDLSGLRGAKKFKDILRAHNISVD